MAMEFRSKSWSKILFVDDDVELIMAVKVTGKAIVNPIQEPIPQPKSPLYERSESLFHGMGSSTRKNRFQNKHNSEPRALCSGACKAMPSQWTSPEQSSILIQNRKNGGMAET
ncbi:MAG: hypothetical protein OEW48_03025 [Phycisphaerae bacterium]|nr:hypothetical protein [Phycisphaerae bacterium]